MPSTTFRDIYDFILAFAPILVLVGTFFGTILTRPIGQYIYNRLNHQRETTDVPSADASNAEKSDGALAANHDIEAAAPGVGSCCRREPCAECLELQAEKKVEGLAISLSFVLSMCVYAVLLTLREYVLGESSKSS